MNEAELDTLMAESTRQFNDFKVQEGTVKAQLEQIDTNLKQLQGEYEAYRTLKQTLVQRREAAAKVSEPVSEPANEANVTPDPFKSKSAKKEVANAAK